MKPAACAAGFFVKWVVPSGDPPLGDCAAETMADCEVEISPFRRAFSRDSALLALDDHMVAVGLAPCFTRKCLVLI